MPPSDRMPVREAALPMTLPAGSFLLLPELDDALRTTCGAAPRTGAVAHPALAFVAALGGSGLPVAEILTRCGCSIEAGPLLASCDLAWMHPLHVGATYRVEGEMTSRQRKPSRRFGAADHLVLSFAITLDGALYVTLKLRMIVPVVAA